MSLGVGSDVRIQIEKPAAGGWMIARAQGQVVLVSGAIPGEQVLARVERIGRGVAYASMVTVIEASADRREPFADPTCGGCLYAHIAYPRQLTIKAQVIADAFLRIGRLPLAEPVAVADSPQDGYRMRARLHVRHRRVGFFREGTHDICDARATRQLLPDTLDILERIVALRPEGSADEIRGIEVSENISASQRAVHVEPVFPPALPGSPALPALVPGITGLLWGSQLVSGDPYVEDALAIDGHHIVLRRHVQAFFQANRFLLPSLVNHVTRFVPQGAGMIDLYAGVGLFAVAAARVRGAHVIAVEGDRVAARDLAANAHQAGDLVEVVQQPVESFTRRRGKAPDLLVLDPPRAGMSREALDRAIALDSPLIVYVSCDVATLARDTRRFVDAGYRLAGIDAFDLFPNTPHVETVVRLER